MKTNLVLLAGRGKRFTDAGYSTPKPLIPVDGLPMFVAAAAHLPPADRLVFVVADTHARDYDITATIRSYFPTAQIVIQTEPLQGQAHSALQAKNIIDPDSELTITSCDGGMTYDNAKLTQALQDPQADALVWAFRNYPPMETNPTSYGWIDIDENRLVKKVHNKTPLSDHPLQDFAVSAWFTYKKAQTCFDNVEFMINHNLKSGLEFSLDECTNVLIQNGVAVKIFEIETFKSWGTPTELKTYEYWQKYFALTRAQPAP